MRELIDRLVDWSAVGTDYALATVVRTVGSAPSPAGTAMAVAADGAVIGGISAGCIESAVLESASRVLESGDSSFLRFGDDDSVFAVGLTCGGTVEVLVKHSRRLTGHLRTVQRALNDGRTAALVTVIDGPPGDVGTQCVWDGSDVAPPTIPDSVLDALRDGLGTAHIAVATERGEGTVFVQHFAPPPKLIVCGALDCAGPLAAMGRMLGYRCVLVDARAVFTSSARFPEFDAVVVDWPHRYLSRTTIDSADVLCVLTHDPKFSLPLFEVALRLPFAYIGAMGSRSTTAARRAALADRGVPAEFVNRLHAPIGLDIGGRSPAETALSIAAEIVAARAGRTGGSLAGRTTAIHAATVAGRDYCLEQV